MFKLLTNTVEGLAQAAIGTVKLVAEALAVPKLTSLTGHFATAAISLVQTLQAYGLTVSAGQSADEELDFCLSVYHGDAVMGCASFHEDQTWSCFLKVGDTTFRCESTPWFSLPDGLDAALRAIGERADEG